MGNKFIIFLFFLITSMFILGCADHSERKEPLVSNTEESFEGVESKANTNAEDEFVLGDGMGTYTDKNGKVHYYYGMPFVRVEGRDYVQSGNPWWNRDEDWLKDNYTYLCDVEYYPDYAFRKDQGDFTTNIDEDGCKVYQCNDDNTFIFTLWSDGVVRLFVQQDLTDEERESASASTEWKK